ncbi:syntaxin-11-like [Genypterus blacodes]|uniref:syntaxin-11-like n=1 Tax=Genypterus blacodes TaxID=154954 RepID=UPI003F75FB74
MLDRLERLQTISEEYEDDNLDMWELENEVDRVRWSLAAVTFDGPSAIDNVLQDVQFLRKDIALLQLEVKRLCTQNERLGTTVRCFTILKKDSDEIARTIQQHGDVLLDKLLAMGEKCIAMEQKEGPSAAVSRIMRAQHDSLTRIFYAAMGAYNDAEEMQRRICRRRVKRQASILGSRITDEQLDTIVDRGGQGWAELSQNLQTNGGKTSRWAQCELKDRHKDLMDLEARMRAVHSLFLQMAMLVEEQGCMINNIEANVRRTEEYVEMTHVHFKTALQYKRKNPFQQCCPCLPCWRPVT